MYNPPSDDKKTYALKETQTHITNNYQNGYHRPPKETAEPPQPRQEPINIQYSYKSSNTTENRFIN